jgi:hypothetical protein
VLGLLNGLLAAIIGYEGFPTAAGCLFSPPLGSVNCAGAPKFFGIASPELQGAILLVGLILATDALVSFAGVRMSFMLGAILSAVVLALFAISWGGPSATVSEAAIALSVATVLVDALASRPSKSLSEKDSPLNLPVFG